MASVCRARSRSTGLGTNPDDLARSDRCKSGESRGDESKKVFAPVGYRLEDDHGHATGRDVLLDSARIDVAAVQECRDNFGDLCRIRGYLGKRWQVVMSDAGGKLKAFWSERLDALGATLSAARTLSSARPV